MRSTLAALALFLLPATALPYATGETWHADFDAAAAVAKEQGKDLLVDFTGSDWCGWCTKLDNEVFSHEEFLEVAQKSFVLVALDYPRKEEAKSKVPNPQRNDEVKTKYGVRGFPTVLLMTAGGEVFASTGYRPGGVEGYLEHLEEISDQGRGQLKETKALISAFEAAQGDEKLAQWEKVLATMESLEAGSPFLSQLAEPARWGLEVDPDNQRGLAVRSLKALLAAGELDEELEAAGRRLDPKNEHGLLEQIVEAQFGSVQDDKTAKAAIAALDGLSAFGFRDNELAFRLNFTAANWLVGPLQDPEAAKKYARTAKDVGSENEAWLARLDEILAG